MYVTPEKLVNFMAELRSLHAKKGICLFAIDETHCVSEWYSVISIMRHANFCIGGMILDQNIGTCGA